MFRCTSLAIVLLTSHLALAATPVIHTLRVPDAGIQPQVAVDTAGTLHLIYFKGDPSHGDLFYTRSADSGATFSPSIRVNSHAGSAIAIGTIRGAQMAIGKNNRVHIAWNGSSAAEPKGSGDGVPMLYTRLNDTGDAFEPERNVIANHYGLDGGGSVAADTEGNVYVGWHAPEKKDQSEEGRRVWIARSTDNGKNFAPESAASPDPTGACGCCGLKLLADSHGQVFVLYRSATEMVHRDMYLLRSEDHAAHFIGKKISPMTIGQCVMSSAVMIDSPNDAIAAWETQSQIYGGRLAKNGAMISDPISAPGPTRNRKHPALASNKAGDILLVWAEGTGWNKGGSIAWQLHDAAGKEISGANGGKTGLPVWSFPASFANADGSFTIVY